MPIRISNKWLRKRLRTLTRLRNDDWGHDWQIQTAPYTTVQQKAIRRMQRDLLSKTVHDVQDWDVYECQLPGREGRTRHIVGGVDHRNTMRVSPAIVSIDSTLREATAETGEQFHFGARVQGGVEVDTYFAWWRDKQGATDVVRVTMEVRDSLLSIREQT